MRKTRDKDLRVEFACDTYITIVLISPDLVQIVGLLFMLVSE